MSIDRDGRYVPNSPSRIRIALIVVAIAAAVGCVLAAQHVVTQKMVGEEAQWWK